MTVGTAQEGRAQRNEQELGKGKKVVSEVIVARTPLLPLPLLPGIGARPHSCTHPPCPCAGGLRIRTLRSHPK
jgi:hypothetical protein